MDTNTTQSTRINSEQVQQRHNSASHSKPLPSPENPYTAMGHGSDILKPSGTLLDDLLTFNFLKGNSRS